MNATQLFPSATSVPATGLFIISFPLICRKFSYGNIYKLLLYRYSYLVAISERCISERIVRVSLDLGDTIVENWLILDVENVSHF